MKLRQFLLLCFLALEIFQGPALLGTKSARAQDDWGVRRDPFDKALIRRYKAILARRPSDSKALGKLMAMYRRYRSIGQLLREYEKAQVVRPGFAGLMVLAYLQEHEGQTDKAMALFRRALGNNPRSLQAHLKLGTLLSTSSAGDRKKAADHFRVVLDLATSKRQKMSALRALADLAMRDRDISAAKAHLESFLKLDPNNSQTLIELGEALAKYKRFGEAIAVFRRAETTVHADPMMKIELATRIGSALEGQGDGLAAVAEYQRAIKIGGRSYYATKDLISRIIGIYRQRQELSTLVKLLDKRWKPARRAHFEWDTMARLYEETGLADKAIDAYRKATKKAPYELDTQRRLISLLENAGREEEALQQFERVIKVAPGEPRFQLDLAARYWKLGKSKQALAMAKKIRSRFSSDPGVIASLADLYTVWQRPAEALAAYQDLVRIDPKDTRYLENLGEHYFQEGFKDNAKQVWKKIIRVKSAANYGRLASIYAEHDLLGDSLIIYAKAIQLAGKDARLYQERANIYERLLRIDDAIGDWNTVLRLSPDKKSYARARKEARRRIVNLLAHTPRRMGPMNRGAPLHSQILVWETGFRKVPPNLGDGLFLVEAYRRTANSAQAQRVLERLLVLRPQDRSLMLQLATVYRERQKNEEAIALLLKLVENDPAREREYYNQVAEIMTEQRRDAEALDYVRLALKKSPNDPVAYQRLAERYQAMQKQVLAISAYEKVLELAPRSFSVSFILARLYINRGDRHKAALLYRHILMTASKTEILSKAGSEAVELEWLNGTLPELLRVVAPLAATLARKPVYRHILVQIYDRYVPILATQLEDGDRSTRLAARDKLNKLGASALRPLLQALADDQDPRQQQIAVSVLGYLGNKAAAPPLLRLAAPEERKPSARITLGGVLGGAAANGRPVASLKEQALIAAARLGDPRAIPALTKLADSKSLLMREPAIFGLGLTANARALPKLLEASRSGRDSVKSLACLAFAEFVDNKSIRSSNTRARAMLLDPALSDRTRAACAWLVGYRKDTKSENALMATLAQGNESAQRIAAWSLGRLGSTNATSALFAAYVQKREPVRESAIRAIEKLLGKEHTPKFDTMQLRVAIYPSTYQRFNEEQTIKSLAREERSSSFNPALLIGQQGPLAEGLRTVFARHRDLMLRTLRDLDGESALSLGTLTAARADLSRAQQKALATTLHKVGQALLPDLSQLAQAADPEVRMHALSLLAKVGGAQALKIVSAGLADSNLRVRESAMVAASRLASRPGADARALSTAILAHLHAKTWLERVATTQVLAHWPGQSGRQVRLNALVQSLRSDKKAFVRAAAALGLGSILERAGDSADQTALATLARAANHSSEPLTTVRLAAVKALQLIGGESARAILDAVAEAEPSKRIRDAATAI